MKVIFLDVDGVLNSYTFATEMLDAEGVSIYNKDILDDRCLACLKQIVQRTGAEIVLSSTWRKTADSRSNLTSQLEKYGLSIHSDTPITNGSRGDDISAWFDQHRGIPIEAYIVLDDNSDVGIHTLHLVRTSIFDGGLQTKHIRQAVDALQCNENEERKKG